VRGLFLSEVGVVSVMSCVCCIRIGVMFGKFLYVCVSFIILVVKLVLLC